MDRALFVYTTFPDEETALAVGESLVRDGLAACVNVLPGTRSVYAWKGGVEQGREATALVKTRTGLRDAVEAALTARHPYELPVVAYLEPEASPGTLGWLLSSTGG